MEWIIGTCGRCVKLLFVGSFKKDKNSITGRYLSNKLKIEIHRLLDETQILFDSLMQDYFE
jgi:hypothetical protein